MKVLVAGGAGFLGSNLCEYLLKEGHEVLCLDKRGRDINDNVKNLFKYKNFKHLAHNVIYQFPRKGDFDQVYNFACPAAPGQYRKDPVDTIKTNIFGTLNLLNCADLNKSKFFQASTVRIFDDINHLGPDACYIEGKKFAETLIMDYKRLYNLNVKIGRLYNTYGPNMSLSDTRVIPQFIMKALKGEELLVYGTGNQRDIFCYVDDMIDEIITYMNDDNEKPKTLGRGIDISIINLANLIIKLSNSASKVRFVKGEKEYKDNLTFVNEEEDFSGITNGLIKTIYYYKERM